MRESPAWVVRILEPLSAILLSHVDASASPVPGKPAESFAIKPGDDWTPRCSISLAVVTSYPRSLRTIGSVIKIPGSTSTQTTTHDVCVVCGPGVLVRNEGG